MLTWLTGRSRRDYFLMHWAEFEFADCAYLEMLLSEAITAHG